MSQENNPDLEILDGNSALASIERASIDQQVATAHQFPRSIKQFMADARDMVTLDLETAEGCYYRLERKGKNGEVKVIEGPSVRLLEIAASCYGNIRYGSRVIAIEEAFVVTQGVAHDLQKNVFSSSETRRRITTSNGRRYGDDMIGVTANAACSIAKRNALNGIVPRVYINQLCDLAMETSRGTTKTLTERRARAVGYFVEKLGVKVDKVLAKLGRAGIEEVTLEDLDRLNGLKTAIKEGDTNVDEEFNPKPDAPDSPKPSLSEILGKKKDEEDVPYTEPKAKTKEKAKDEPPAKTFTPEERSAILKNVETLMLDNGVTESKILLYCHEKKLAKEGQDAVGSLDSAVLAQLLAIIPTLKAK